MAAANDAYKVLKWLFTANEHDDRAVLAAKYLHKNKNVYDMIYDCVVKSFPKLDLSTRNILYDSIVVNKNLNVDILVNTAEGKMILQDHYDFIHDVMVHIDKLHLVNNAATQTEYTIPWYTQMKNIATNWANIPDDVKLWFNRLTFGTAGAGNQNTFGAAQAQIAAWDNTSASFFRFNSFGGGNIAGLNDAANQVASQFLNLDHFYRNLKDLTYLEKKYMNDVCKARNGDITGATVDAIGAVASFILARFTNLKPLCEIIDDDLILKKIITTKNDHSHAVAFTLKTKFMCHNLSGLIEKSYLSGLKPGPDGWNFVDQNGVEHKFEKALDFQEFLDELKCMGTGLFTDPATGNCDSAQFNEFIRTILNNGTKDEKREKLYNYLNNTARIGSKFDFLKHNEEAIKKLHPVIAREILIVFGFEIHESTGKFETIPEWINKLKRLFGLQSGGVYFPGQVEYDSNMLSDDEIDDIRGELAAQRNAINIIKNKTERIDDAVVSMSPKAARLDNWVATREAHRTERVIALNDTVKELNIIHKVIDTLKRYLESKRIGTANKTYAVEIVAGNEFGATKGNGNGPGDYSQSIRGHFKAAADGNTAMHNTFNNIINLVGTGTIRYRNFSPQVNLNAENLEIYEVVQLMTYLNDRLGACIRKLSTTNTSPYIMEGGVISSAPTNTEIYRILTDRSNAYIHNFLQAVWNIANYRTVGQSGKFMCNKHWQLDTNNVIPVKERNPVLNGGAVFNVIESHLAGNLIHNIGEIPNYSYNFIPSNSNNQSGGRYHNRFSADGWRKLFGQIFGNPQMNVSPQFKEGVMNRITKLSESYEEINNLQQVLRDILSEDYKPQALNLINTGGVMSGDYNGTASVEQLNDIKNKAKDKLVKAQQRANYCEQSLCKYAKKCSFVMPFVY